MNQLPINPEIICFLDFFVVKDSNSIRFRTIDVVSACTNALFILRSIHEWLKWLFFIEQQKMNLG